MHPSPDVQMRAIADTKSAVLGLRRALNELFASVGADPTRPQELSRQFKLDKTLTWKISRVIREDDASAAVAHVPGRRRMLSLVSSMRTAGAPVDLVDATMAAFDEFERLVDVHSGDRETLDVMVTSVSSDAGRRRQETFRKAGFQSNAAVWGVKAKLQIAMNIVGPAGADGSLDTGTLCGFVGLQRLRANLPWAIANVVSWDGPSVGGTESPSSQPVSLGEGGVLIPDFCSSPLPPVRTVQVNGKDHRYELAEGAIGRRDAVSVFLGWKWQGFASAYGLSEGELGEHGMYMSTPVETAILELWIHRSLTFALDPKARVYSNLPSGPKYPQEGPDVGFLPLGSEVADLGVGALGASSSEYPQGPELLTYGARNMGIDPDELHGFRFRLKYPPIPTFAVMQHPLLTRP